MSVGIVPQAVIAVDLAALVVLVAPVEIVVADLEDLAVLEAGALNTPDQQWVVLQRQRQRRCQLPSNIDLNNRLTDSTR